MKLDPKHRIEIELVAMSETQGTPVGVSLLKMDGAWRFTLRE